MTDASQKQRPEVFYKNRCSEKFNLCQAPGRVFSSKFCELFNNTFFAEHLRTTASGLS